MDPGSDASDSSGDEEVPSSPSSGDGDGGLPPELAEDPPQPESQQQPQPEPEPQPQPQPQPHPHPQRRNRYDEQKRRDWSTFLRFLENRKPRLTLSRVRSPHVMEFLKSIDGFGKTLVHEQGCLYFGHPDPPNPPCSCPLRQSWGSLDALVGRLRAACEDAPSRPETNPFGVRAVRNYLLQVKNAQATARGIPYSRKRKPRLPDNTAAADAPPPPPPPPPPLLLEAPPVSVEGFRGEATTSTTCVTGKEFITLPEGSVAEAEESSDPPQEEGSAAAATTTTTSTCTSVVVEEESAATVTGTSMATASPSSADPLLGSVGQDVPVQLQICWVRPPVRDNQTTPPFLPIWRYPAMQSLVSFMPPLPYIPTPSPQRTKEKVMRVPKQESQTEEEPLGTGEEVPSSSNDGGGGDTTQAVEHTAPLLQQRNRYEEQKRRDWNTFLRFLENRQPRLTLSRVRSPHVIEFLKSIDQFGKTLVHEPGCPYFGQPNPAAPCACPLRQSWGSLDALVGRLRAACEESPNRPETNPFGVRAVRNYLLQVKDSQATARGIPYSRKRKRNLLASSDTIPSQAPSDGESGDGEESAAAAAANTCVISSTCGEEPSTTSTIIPPSASPSLMGEESGDIPGGISSIS